MDLISVVLGGKEKNSEGLTDRFNDTKNLFNFVYYNYKYKQIAENGQIIKKLYIENATNDTSSLDVIINKDIYSIIPNNLDVDSIPRQINLNEKIEAPIKKNQVLGTVTFEADGFNYTTDLLASHDVEKESYMIYSILLILLIIVVLLIILKLLANKKPKKRNTKKKRAKWNSV